MYGIELIFKEPLSFTLLDIEADLVAINSLLHHKDKSLTVPSKKIIKDLKKIANLLLTKHS